jgi:hypothetical protein
MQPAGTCGQGANRAEDSAQSHQHQPAYLQDWSTSTRQMLDTAVEIRERAAAS